MLAGAISVDPSVNAQSLAQTLAGRATRAPLDQHRLLFGSPNIAVYVIERPDDRPRVPHWSMAGGDLWLIGDICYKQAPADLPPPISLEDFCTRTEYGRCIALQSSADRSTLKIASDRLGIQWLYLAKIKGGFLFASHFAALAELVRDTLTLDYPSMLMELALGYTPDQRTVFNEIQLMPPGAVIEITSRGIENLYSVPVVYGDRHFGASQQQKYALLDEAFDRIALSQMIPHQSQLVLSLSAGFDSRYALGFLRRHHLSPSCFTFGHPDSEEIFGARAVAEKSGLTTDVFQIPETDWDQWRNSIRFLGNAGMVQWSGWAESWLTYLRQHGRYSVIGYIGDAMTGKHVGTSENRIADWLDFWINWSKEGGWGESALLTDSARTQLGDAMNERFKARLRGASFASPFQQVLHLDIYGRQRRWVATQPNLVGRFVTPLLFFYDAELMDFWANVAFQDLTQQNLYLSYARDRFSHLFPQNEGARPSFALRAMRKARRVLSGRSSLPRPPVIDQGQNIIRNRERILALLRKVSPAFEPILDIKQLTAAVSEFGQRPTISAGHITRVVNLAFLIELCFD
jgi:hypothetical protein